MTNTTLLSEVNRRKKAPRAVVIVAGFLLAALLGWGTWKAVYQQAKPIKIDVAPLPVLNIGTGRISITHNVDSGNWIAHGSATSNIEMIVHRDELLNSFTYAFQTTAGGRGGNRNGGFTRAGGRGPAQVPPSVANLLAHADQLKLTADQEAQLAILDLADLPVAQIDPSGQQAAIGHWLDLLAAPTEKEKTVAEWHLIETLDSISTKVQPYTQYPNAILDVYLKGGGNVPGILSASQMTIYRKLEQEAATQPVANPAFNRNFGATANPRGPGNTVANTGAATAARSTTRTAAAASRPTTIP